MNFSRFIRPALFIACGLLVLCSARLNAQQPAPESAGDRVRLTLAQPTGDVAELLLNQIDRDAHDGAWLRLAVFTYRNTLGVEIGAVDAALRDQLELAEGSGVLVTEVNAESEAAKAGLRKHDLVLKINDQAIAGQQQFDELISGQQGQTLQLHLLRRGKPVALSIAVPVTPVYRTVVRQAFNNIAQRQALAGWIVDGNPPVENHYRIGVTLSEADDVLRSQLRLATGEGLVVTDVVAESPAAAAGIQKNDVLVKLDGKRLTTVELVNAQIQEIKDRKTTIALVRGGAEISLEVTAKLTSTPTAAYHLWTSLRDPQGLHVWEVQAADALRSAIEAKPTAGPAEQITALKKQLADLQKAVESLEASLQTNSPEKPAIPEEKK